MSCGLWVPHDQGCSSPPLPPFYMLKFLFASLGLTLRFWQLFLREEMHIFVLRAWVEGEGEASTAC